MQLSIRATLAKDLEAIREVERRAGARFRLVDLPDVAEHEPTSVDALAVYLATGGAFTAADGDDIPVGFIIVSLVDGHAHIDQVSVRPDWQGLGLGRALVEVAVQWAIEHGCNSLTLRTFMDVPWNRPLYEHLGFRVIPKDEEGPELAAIRGRESELGLNPRARVSMWLDLSE